MLGSIIASQTDTNGVNGPTAGQQVPVYLIIVHHQDRAGFSAGNGSTFLSQFPGGYP
jgi:hypothetical protein